MEHLPKDLIRIEGGVIFVDHKTLLGIRHTMAGVEQALMGMKVGGYGKFASALIWPTEIKTFRT
jgi:hypothetical protein